MSRRVPRSPRYLDLEITSRCNLACTYCYFLDNPGVVYADLPTAAWLDLFDEFAACRVLHLSFCGGEPLWRDDFAELVDGVVARQMRFDLLTNGSLLTPELARHLRASRRCDMVQVSLDGSHAASHETLRSRGSFAPALAAIELLQSLQLPVTVRVTIHPGNIEDLPDLARLLLDDLGLPSFSTNAASPLGDRDKYPPTALLGAAQRLRAMQLLAELDRRYPGRILANAGPLAEWKTFHAMEAARLAGQPIPGRGRLVGCGCVFDRMAVRADGAYTPCVMLPQCVLGQAGQESLVDVWQNADLLQRMRQRVDIPLSRFAECHGCPWLESCTGNCPGIAYSLLGEIDRPSPSACLQRFVRESAAAGRAFEFSP
ncbi:MAG: SynChlorMet cassette radical SAM/SPASM protein ScmE [Desulfuromonadales bacterium]|nr:SynChlorMet cassette radical SAM/SPASM protein ScmE [Desulfuromonadales bacterium]